MPQFMIERRFGHDMTPEEVAKVGSESKRQQIERFPELLWEHSHCAEEEDGFVAYCIYVAPSEQYVRDHAAASGLPCGRVVELTITVEPTDFE